jgi:capsular exopolysaccharide synthesis family protein
LAVTSAANHEGKTSVAVQLAVSIARALGEPTLIIDGDMRSPGIHRVFEIPLQPGLAKVLAGECEIHDAIVQTSTENVSVLPAGELRVNPHTLLANGALESLLHEVASDYRYVIIDTPPVLAASEALILARVSDATLMCAMRDVSRIHQVKKATERVVAAGGRVAGTVLSGVPVGQYIQRYGNYPYQEG